MNIKFYLKILGSLLVSYTLVLLLSPIVYESDSFPIPRKNLDRYVATKFSEYSSNMLSIIKLNPEDREKATQLVQENVFVNIAPNVKAKDFGSTVETVYDMNNMQFTEYTYKRKNGEVIVLKIPVGISPPPEGRF